MSNQNEDNGARRAPCAGRCYRLTLLLLSALLVTACMGRVKLRPAATAQTLPGEKKAAVAEAAGVRMVVETDQWSGYPVNLNQVATPLRVTVENRSSEPLRLRYNEFTLSGAEGFTAAALPPYRIEGSVTTAVARPAFRPRFIHRGFYYAPYYAPYWRGLRPWGSPWAYDPLYYDRYYTYWQTPLPTGDMLEMAIPEGVIEPQGSIRGFLYFQRLNKDLRTVTFKADLVNAQTGRTFGTITIPFVVK